jgi:hypothetical protein
MSKYCPIRKKILVNFNELRTDENTKIGLSVANCKQVNILIFHCLGAAPRYIALILRVAVVIIVGVFFSKLLTVWKILFRRIKISALFGTAFNFLHFKIIIV